jgi:hypothetical protein
MEKFFRVLTMLSLLTFALFAFLGIKGYVAREYMAAPFGLAFMSFCLHTAVSRRDLWAERTGRVAAGSTHWKTFLYVLWLGGTGTAFVGADAFFATRFGSALAVHVATAGVCVAILGLAYIHRISPSRTKRATPDEIIINADTYVFYGQPGKALQILEELEGVS